MAVLLVAILWIVSLALVWQIEARTRNRIDAAVQLVTALHQQDGKAALIDFFAPDGERIRPQRDLLIAKSEDELIGVLRGQDALPIAGFSGLYGEAGWSTAELDYAIAEGPVRAYRFEIEGELQATIAAFVPPRIARIHEFARAGTWALGVTVLPLGILIGLLVSRRVVRRLNALAEAVEGIASGKGEMRAELSFSGDDFDRLSVSVNTMLDRLQTLHRNIEDVSIGVAHDLKTPLGNIGGRLQLMTRDIEDPDALARHIDAAEHHIQALLRTFNALLRLGEVEAGSRRANFKSVNLSEVMADVGGSFAPVFTDHDKALEIRVAPDVTIDGDEALLVQLASNLLENIVEHGRDGAQAWIALSVKDGAPVLEIGDDGPGIPEPHRGRVFERFYRVEASRSTSGNGLGLSLVKAIADLHGAWINIDPAASGTVLTIRFPATGGYYKPV
ncbi:MAG: HAMP domain-containing sensor histidine kinase [Pseudomonadota bacterium]